MYEKVYYMTGQHNIRFSQFCPHCWFFQCLWKLGETLLGPFSTMNSKRTCWQFKSKCQIRKTEHCSSVHVFCSLLVVRQIVGDPKNNEMSRAQFRASYMMLLVTRNATKIEEIVQVCNILDIMFSKIKPIDGTMIVIHDKMNNIGSEE